MLPCSKLRYLKDVNLILAKLSGQFGLLELVSCQPQMVNRNGGVPFNRSSSSEPPKLVVKAIAQEVYSIQGTGIFHQNTVMLQAQANMNKLNTITKIP